MKVWLLSNTPSAYQVEFLGAIQRSGKCDLDVRLMRAEHRGRRLADSLEGVLRSRTLGGIGPRLWADAFRFHPRAAWEAVRGAHDLFVLSGQYTSITFVACALLLSMRRRAWVAWLERPWPAGYRPAWTGSVSARIGVAARLRRGLLRRLLSLARCVFCIGTSAVEAYAELGLPPSKLVSLPYFCDTARFAGVSREAVAAVRGRHGLEGKTVFLFSGLMAKRKGVDLLMEAFQRMAHECPGAALLLMGEGELRAELEASVPPGLQDRVRFAGAVRYEDLPAYFGAADVFVLPSRHDGWAVVINEACAAGLPVITTRAVGAARDLVREGENGFVLERDDVAGLAEKMAFFARAPEQARRFGARSLEIIREFTLEKGVERFCELARAAQVRPTGSDGSDRSAGSR